MKKSFGDDGREREIGGGGGGEGVVFFFFFKFGSQLDIDMWQEKVESDHIKLF